MLAAPTNNMVEANVNNFESKFPRLSSTRPSAPPKLRWRRPSRFTSRSRHPGRPMPAPGDGRRFNVWQNALFDPTKQAWEPQDIPEGGGVPSLWPLVVLTKLDTSTEPARASPRRATPTHPVIILQGITLLGGDGTGDPTKADSLFNTRHGRGVRLALRPGVRAADRLHAGSPTVLVRPAVICFDTLFDATNPDKRGTIVTPHLFGADGRPPAVARHAADRPRRLLCSRRSSRRS